jgi:ABC-type spermidine/putrescine transport system permease subunit I
MTVLIYQQFSQVFNWPFGSAVAVALLVLTFLVLFIFLRIVMRRAAAWMESRPEENAT